MKQYMFIIRGGDEMEKSKSPEEMEAHMQLWQTWMGGLAAQGKLIGGEPLETAAKSIIDGGTKVIDRPLAEGKELVGGYIMVYSDSLEEATEIAKGCPGFELNCTLEIRQIRPL